MSGPASPFNAAAFNAEQLGVLLLRELAEPPSGIDKEKVTAILDRFKALGAPPQDLKNDLWETPVLLAIKGSHFDLAERMIDEGWDVTARDRNRMSAGVYALAKGREDMEVKMREKGLRPRSLDSRRVRLLSEVYAWVAVGNADAAVDRLVVRGGDINILEDKLAARASRGMKRLPKDGLGPTN